MKNTLHNYEKQSKFTFILAMFIFGTIGIFRNYIPLPSSLIALARGLIGTLFLGTILKLKGIKLSITAIKSQLLLLILSGAFLGFNWIFLFEAYQYTTVSTATLCYYMAPILVIIASPILFKERLTLRKVFYVLIALIGMIFVSGIHKTQFLGSIELKGILYGLGAAIFYAGLMLTNKIIKNVSAYEKTVAQLGIASIILLPYCLFTENLSQISFTPLSLTMLAIVGIVHTGIAYTLYFGAMNNLKAHTIALFSYIDPIIAIVLSALILHETMGPLELLGTFFILGATLLDELTTSS